MVNHSLLSSGRVERWASRLPLRVVALSLLVVLALVGCASTTAHQQPSGRQTFTTPTPIQPTPTQSITYNNPAPTLTLAQAWGNVSIAQVPSLLPNGEIFQGGNNATPDGQWLIGEVEPRGELNNQSIYPQTALYNIHTLQLRVIRTLRSPQSRIDNISTDGRWLAWTDAVDPGSDYDWVMYLCDLQTGAIRTLATAAHINGQAAVGPHAGPYISDGYAIWTEATAPVQQGNLNSLKNVLVQEESLFTGAITTLATSAFVQSFSWPWVAWGQYTSVGSGAVDLQNLVTQQHQQLNGEPAAFTLDGAAAALEDSDDFQVQIVSNIAQSVVPQTVFATDPTGNPELGYLSINDRLVAWEVNASDPTPVVWDRTQHVTVTLPTMNSPATFGAYVSGNALIWTYPALSPAQEQAGEQQGLTPLSIYCIIDTSQLPTKAPGA